MHAETKMSINGATIVSRFCLLASPISRQCIAVLKYFVTKDKKGIQQVTTLYIYPKHIVLTPRHTEQSIVFFQYFSLNPLFQWDRDFPSHSLLKYLSHSLPRLFVRKQLLSRLNCWVKSWTELILGALFGACIQKYTFFSNSEPEPSIWTDKWRTEKRPPTSSIIRYQFLIPVQ